MNFSIDLTRLKSSDPSRSKLTVVRRARRRSTSRFQSVLVMLEAIGDFVAVGAAAIAGYGVHVLTHLGRPVHYPCSVVLAASGTLGVVVVLMLDRAGVYSSGTSLLRVRETEKVLRVSMQTSAFSVAVSFCATLLFSRWLLLVPLLFVPLFLLIEKHLVYVLVRHLHGKGIGIERVLIYGSGSTGRRVYSVLRRSPKLGLDPVVLVDDNPAKEGSTIFELSYERRRSAPVVCGPITKDLIRRWAADQVIIAIPSLQNEEFQQTVEQALAANARVSFVPSHLFHSDVGTGFRDIDGVLIASFNLHSRRFAYECAKRILDFGGAAFLLVVCAPLFLLLALLIKFDSEGPVFFGQSRVGTNGRHFRMFKFRTMYVDVPGYAYSPRVADDRRITPIGRFLRRTSLDELPQLFNVLLGNMSLVGPRPEMPFIVAQYNNRQLQRLDVKPGITGLWQLSGDRNYLIHENIEYDLYYIQHRNFFMDLAILLHTPIFAVRGI